MGRLDGQVAIVTGGGRGIGVEYAKVLAAEGAKVAVTDIVDTETTVNIIKQGNGDILLLNSRIRDYGDLPKLIEEARESTMFSSGDDICAILLKEVFLRALPNVFAIEQVSSKISEDPTSSRTAPPPSQSGVNSRPEDVTVPHFGDWFALD